MGYALKCRPGSYNLSFAPERGIQLGERPQHLEDPPFGEMSPGNGWRLSHTQLELMGQMKVQEMAHHTFLDGSLDISMDQELCIQGALADGVQGGLFQ